MIFFLLFVLKTPTSGEFIKAFHTTVSRVLILSLYPTAALSVVEILHNE